MYFCLFFYILVRNIKRDDTNRSRVCRQSQQVWGIYLSSWIESLQIFPCDKCVRVEHIHDAEEHDYRQECPECKSIIFIFDKDFIQQERKNDGEKDNKGVAI